MKNAFTLIEVIATLLLVAILAVSVAISLLPMTQGLMQVRANAATAQKARLAMSRIAREFTTITAVVSSSSDEITYDFLVPAGNWYATLRHTLSRSGDELLLNGIPLCDDVADFDLNLDYTAGAPYPAIGVLLSLQSVVGDDTYATSYSNQIAPRNMFAGP
ncbi:MAG: type II secretion system protein J [Kiritimatiellia bacterium]